MTDPAHAGANEPRLSGWIDGGLDKDEMIAMDKLVSEDPDLIRQAERLRHLDNLVRAAVPAEDTVPVALLERLGLAEPTRSGADIIDFASARARQDAPPIVARRRWFMSAGMTRAAGLAVVAGLGLALFALRPLPPANTDSGTEYTALSAASRGDAARPAATAIVMFNSGTSLTQAQAILAPTGAHIVAGPSSGGVWQIAIAPAQQGRVLSGLKSNPQVKLAEPLDGSRP